MLQLAAAPERVAIIQTAFLGDVVFTSPLVRAVRRAFPETTISFVSTPKAAALAGCIPGVDRVVPFDKRGKDKGISGLRRVAKALEHPDLVLVPHPSLRSAALAKLSGARVRIGHADRWTKPLYSHTVALRSREPFVERFLDLARAVSVEGEPDLVLKAPEAEVQKAEALLAGRKVVALVVGSEWGTKRWPAEHFAGLADRLAEAGYESMLFGAPSERPLAEAVLANVKKAKPIDVVGNSILESLGLLAKVQGVVGGDSGLLHMSRALGTPSLLLFGPTDPGVHCLEPHAQALRLGLECQPCHAHGPKVCPLKHHDCMRKLDVARVASSLLSLMASARAA